MTVRLVGRPGATAGITPPEGEEERLFSQELRGQTDDAGRYAFQVTLPDIPMSANGDEHTLPPDPEAAVAAPHQAAPRPANSSRSASGAGPAKSH